ncbi:MAG TPA: UDP-N-acetylmuramoyl-L-alanine--D-glutamate ligase [Planctomycetota bacterium]|nr:UDP-N-acetylmuramoyl-L-alanine--D-glutamate ligase [Planctomycetota bacterium]
MTLRLGDDLPPVARVAVIGLARSGRAAASLLSAHGVEVVANDAKPAAAFEPALVERPRLRYVLGGHPAEVLDGVDLVVTSPGLAPSHPLPVEARARGLPLLPEVELARRLAPPGIVVGVTGTNGKSTTTALAAALLGEAGYGAVACGNIGTPFSAVVEAPPPPGSRGRAYVVELSSFQLEAVRRFRCDVAALLNLAPDHLDRHGTAEAYLAAKARIFEGQRAEDAVVLPDAAPWIAALPALRARRLAFSAERPTSPGAFFRHEAFHVDLGDGRGPMVYARRSDLTLVGAHNILNALAALAATAPLGVDPTAATRAFRGFRALPHRCALVRERGGVRWVDDSKGTNVDATVVALEGFADGTVRAILGGKDKGEPFARLAPALRRKAKEALLVGATAERLERELAEAGIPLVRCGTLERAVARAAETAAPGDVVLLSPACASFDQFRDYEHRGQVFSELVAALSPADAPAGGPT